MVNKKVIITGTILAGAVAGLPLQNNEPGALEHAVRTVLTTQHPPFSHHLVSPFFMLSVLNFAKSSSAQMGMGHGMDAASHPIIDFSNNDKLTIGKVSKRDETHDTDTTAQFTHVPIHLRSSEGSDFNTEDSQAVGKGVKSQKRGFRTGIKPFWNKNKKIIGGVTAGLAVAGLAVAGGLTAHKACSKGKGATMAACDGSVVNEAPPMAWAPSNDALVVSWGAPGSNVGSGAGSIAGTNSDADANVVFVAPTVPESHAPSVAGSDAGLIAPFVAESQVGSIAPIIAGSVTPSVAESFAGAFAPSVAKSQAGSVAPSAPESQAGSIAPSVAESQAGAIAPSSPESQAIAPSSPESQAVAPSNPESQAGSYAPSIAESQGDYPNLVEGYGLLYDSEIALLAEGDPDFPGPDRRVSLRERLPSYSSGGGMDSPPRNRRVSLKDELGSQYDSERSYHSEADSQAGSIAPSVAETQARTVAPPIPESNAEPIAEPIAKPIAERIVEPIVIAEPAAPPIAGSDAGSDVTVIPIPALDGGHIAEAIPAPQAPSIAETIVPAIAAPVAEAAPRHRKHRKPISRPWEVDGTEPEVFTGLGQARPAGKYFPKPLYMLNRPQRQTGEMSWRDRQLTWGM